MLPARRHSEILKQLELEGSVRTAELCKKLGVSDETIRQDLEVLDQEGRLLKVHGGATRIELGRELGLSERLSIHRAEKTAIGKMAAARVREGETIFLDASSTALTLVDFLPPVRLTILTNAQNVVVALGERPNCDIICTGGLWDARSRSYIGLLAEESLRRYRIHRMFFSGNAFDLVRGVSEVSSRQAVFKERVIPLADEVCLLADSSKLGARSSFYFCPVESLTSIFTDTAADPAFPKAAAQRGVETVLAPP